MSENLPVAQSDQISNLILDPGTMESMVKLSEIMATGRCTLPQEYQGKPGDCLAVIMQAMQWRMNPYALAQKTYFIKGRIGYEGQLVNAAINAMAPTRDRLHFEFFGDWDRVVGKFAIKTNEKNQQYRVPAWKLEDEEGLGVMISATLKGESEPRKYRLLLSQCQTRNSTQWADDPQQQLTYVGARKWARRYCPDVLLGVYTPDELEDVDEVPVELNITPEPEPQPTVKRDPAKVETKAYPEEKFRANVEKWASQIVKRKMTVEQFMGWAAEKNIALSERQKSQLIDMVQAQEESA